MDIQRCFEATIAAEHKNKRPRLVDSTSNIRIDYERPEIQSATHLANVEHMNGERPYSSTRDASTWSVVLHSGLVVATSGDKPALNPFGDKLIPLERGELLMAHDIDAVNIDISDIENDDTMVRNWVAICINGTYYTILKSELLKYVDRDTGHIDLLHVWANAVRVESFSSCSSSSLVGLSDQIQPAIANTAAASENMGGGTDGDETDLGITTDGTLETERQVQPDSLATSDVDLTDYDQETIRHTCVLCEGPIDESTDAAPPVKTNACSHLFCCECANALNTYDFCDGTMLSRYTQQSMDDRSTDTLEPDKERALLLEYYCDRDYRGIYQHIVCPDPSCKSKMRIWGDRGVAMEVRNTSKRIIRHMEEVQNKAAVAAFVPGLRATLPSFKRHTAASPITLLRRRADRHVREWKKRYTTGMHSGTDCSPSIGKPDIRFSSRWFTFAHGSFSIDGKARSLRNVTGVYSTMCKCGMPMLRATSIDAACGNYAQTLWGCDNHMYDTTTSSMVRCAPPVDGWNAPANLEQCIFDRLDTNAPKGTRVLRSFPGPRQVVMLDAPNATNESDSDTLIYMDMPDHVILIFEGVLRTFLTKNKIGAPERRGRFISQQDVNGRVEAHRAHRSVRYKLYYEKAALLSQYAVMTFPKWKRVVSCAKGERFNTLLPNHIGHMGPEAIQRHQKTHLRAQFETMGKVGLKQHCFSKRHADGKRLWNGMSPIPSKHEMRRLLYEWSERQL